VVNGFYVTHYRNCLASAIANSVPSEAFRTALRQLGQGTQESTMATTAEMVVRAAVVTQEGIRQVANQNAYNTFAAASFGGAALQT
jgi:hypothetical protein